MNRWIMPLLLLLACLSLSAKPGQNLLFSKIDNKGDHSIFSIVHLPDCRTAFATGSGIDIFDGARFSHLYKTTGEVYPLSLYEGYHHLYITHNGKYLWIKNRKELQCILLDSEIYATDITNLFQSMGITQRVDDLFADSYGRLWTVSGQTLSLQGSSFKTILSGQGDLLDLAADHSCLYLFLSTGYITCIDLKTGATLYSIPYPQSGKEKYVPTSLIAETEDSFFQIRNSINGGNLLCFDKKTQGWKTELTSPMRFNTMALSDSVIYITTTEGMIRYSPALGRHLHIPYLRTINGNLLASELSTISSDGNAGLWIGTVRNGIYHYNPFLHTYASVEKHGQPHQPQSNARHVFSENPDGSVDINADDFFANVIFSDTLPPLVSIGRDRRHIAESSGVYGTEASFVSSRGIIFFEDSTHYSIYIPDRNTRHDNNSQPFLSGILINAVRISPLMAVGDDVVLDKIPSKTESISLTHDQNFITFEVTQPDISDPSPEFLYMMEGIDPDWREAGSSEIRDRMLTTTYTALNPGEYTFRVKTSASPGSPETSIRIHIRHPWWSSPVALTVYAILLISILWISTRFYLARERRKIEARQREEGLLEKIRQLIEEVDRYKTESPDTPATMTEDTQERSCLSDEEKQFVAHAVELVERNLDTPGYSVAQLSSDLCMDRTGLYRKLTTLLDQSPSLFIRDIRLRKAAAMIIEGKLSITEIAFATGFSSTSYMSKCFQERYGCRPSEFSGQ